MSGLIVLTGVEERLVVQRVLRTPWGETGLNHNFLAITLLFNEYNDLCIFEEFYKVKLNQPRGQTFSVFLEPSM
jgi:hypothetical protein